MFSGNMEITSCTPSYRMLTNPDWLPYCEDYRLSSNDVHIWRARLDQPPDQAAFLATILSKDEQIKAGRFYYARDRSRFIVGRAILRILLSRYLALSPNNVGFIYKQCGKPILVEDINGIDLQFNLSHSSDLILYAFTRYRELGVDLEYQRFLPDMKELVSKHFSQAEYAKWSKMPTFQQEETFFLWWTRKEAFLKAKGDGLFQPLNSIEVFTEADVEIRSGFGDGTSDEVWSCVSLVPLPGYLASLVIPGYNWQLTFQEYS
jgi:4'-phosphopantetheinyl transferase